MITEFDIDEAINKCLSEENPTNNTCVRLAAFLTIKDFLFDPKEEISQSQMVSYSYDSGNKSDVVQYESESEFFQKVNGKSTDDVWKIVDELVETIQAVNPRLYAGIMRKVDSI